MCCADFRAHRTLTDGYTLTLKPKKKKKGEYECVTLADS